MLWTAKVMTAVAIDFRRVRRAALLTSNSVVHWDPVPQSSFLQVFTHIRAGRKTQNSADHMYQLHTQPHAQKAPAAIKPCQQH